MMFFDSALAMPVMNHYCYGLYAAQTESCSGLTSFPYFVPVSGIGYHYFRSAFQIVSGIALAGCEAVSFKAYS